MVLPTSPIRSSTAPSTLRGRRAAASPTKDSCQGAAGRQGHGRPRPRKHGGHGGVACSGARVRNPRTSCRASGRDAEPPSIALRPEGVLADAALADSTPDSVLEALNFRPSLSRRQLALCAITSAAAAGAIAVRYAPAEPGARFAMGVAALFGAMLALLRGRVLEGQWQSIMRPEEECGDRGSKFRDVRTPSGGIFTRAHYKCAMPPAGAGPPGLAVAAYHGFGANVYSWGAVQAPLAAALNAVVTCHDMPGLGLTVRPRSMAAYSLEHNGYLGRRLMDVECAKSGLLPASAAHHDVPPASAQGDGARPEQQMKRVLIGHSLGAACAMAEALRDPTAIAAMVMIAPAIFAPSRNGNAAAQSEGASTKEETDTRPSRPSLTKRLAALSCGLLCITVRILQPLVVWTLRSLVRSRRFWENGVGSAYARPRRLKPELVDQYRLPSIVRGWERGFVDFLCGRFSGGKTEIQLLSLALFGDDGTEQASGTGSSIELFISTLQRHRIPVLILHGDRDMLVPSSNSQRLAQVLPRCAMQEFKDCGHNLHEEMPAEFVTAVEGFLKTTAVRK